MSFSIPLTCTRVVMFPGSEHAELEGKTVTPDRTVLITVQGPTGEFVAENTYSLSVPTEPSVLLPPVPEPVTVPQTPESDPPPLPAGTPLVTFPVAPQAQTPAAAPQSAQWAPEPAPMLPMETTNQTPAPAAPQTAADPPPPGV